MYYDVFDENITMDSSELGPIFAGWVNTIKDEEERVKLNNIEEAEYASV